MTTIRVPLFRGDGTIVAWSLIDETDAYVVFKRRWHLSSNGYATCTFGGSTRPMHRLLLRGQIGTGYVADHISRNKLDNRRANLRITTPERNGQNTGGRLTWRGRPASSKYRGVSWKKEKKKWLAHARYRGVQHRLGLFDVELEAARAVRDFWAVLNIDVDLDESSADMGSAALDRDVPLICECGHYVWNHVTTSERRGCFPPDGCDCREFRPILRGDAGDGHYEPEAEGPVA